MRLSKIKIAGFKSFVDATEVLLPSNLIGVVGPNGCGKSNIIDAVRWVMGETSAKMLRGEAMTDVIFTGSASRKPVGMATVELIFDNSDGQIQGEYANYNEISVKRQVNRDAQSFYYLNNSKCRKKDIVDLFLGTGLGPRSYSIIEQGMISKIVESRPEDLRGYIEEAAGVSKYRDRRRDTERRIARTRENLERLDDLRSEVGKHIQHLQRQAKNAERYGKLKEQYRQSQAEILAWRWQEWSLQAGDAEKAVLSGQTDLEKHRADLTHQEKSFEELRLAHQELMDNNSKIQEQLYQINSEVGKVEQAITYAQSLSERQKQDLQSTEHNIMQSEKQLTADEAALQDAREQIKLLEPAVQEVELGLQQAQEQNEQAELLLNQSRQGMETVNQELSERNRIADVQRTKIAALDANLMRQSERLESLAKVDTDDESAGIQQAVEELLDGKQLQQARHEEFEQQLNTAKEAREVLLVELNQARTSLQELQQKLHQTQGKRVSLRALQQAAQASDNHDIKAWLESNQNIRGERLSDLLQVNSGWEQAVERALSNRLQALISDASDLDDVLEGWQFGHVTAVSVSTGQVKPKAGTLAAEVKGPDVVYEWFNHIMVCEDLATAKQKRGQLQPGEIIITRDGDLMGQHWLETHKGEQHDSFLLRQKELTVLDQEIETAEQSIVELEQQLETQKAKRTELDQQIEQRQLDLNMSHRRLAELDSQITAKNSQIEQIQQRREQLSGEAQTLKQQIETDQVEIKSARGVMEEALNAIAELQEQKESNSASQHSAEDQYQHAKSILNALSSEFYQKKMQLQGFQNQVDAGTQGMRRLQDTLDVLKQRKQEILQQIAEENDPAQQHQQTLEKLIEQRLDIETRRDQSQQQVNASREQLDVLEKQRHQHQQQIDNARSTLENAKLDWQSKQLKAGGFKEQLEDKGFVAEELVEQLDHAVDIESRELGLEKLQRSIVRLEPVNLAAIDEFEEESKRKEYLDAQNDDLEQALEKLESAIQKIDRDTRTLFKETFEEVNSNIKQIFPRLFGGGHAYLELTGNDLLTTGVAIMARPPGKRVSSIQLLSGGEKALTAVSLVFAIFNLNPAPFCLLDEVDAPLDDANVKRFSDMVAEMSEKVQFLFVTHNKITMEIANQLMGVTMREAGVSRLVSVDLAEAEKMVE